MTVHRQNNVHSAVQRLNRPPSATGRPKTTTASSTSLNVSQISSQSLISSSGNECVKVVVRCRPLSSTEQTQGHSCCVNVDSKSGIIELTNPQCPEEPAKCFSFDSAFDSNSKQFDVYDEAVRPIVDSVLQGFNGTVFAYGQTGTGKTYTMEGPSGIGKNIASDQRGVIPNSIDQIFQHIAQSPPSLQYLVRASFLEIYQEEIRDLLDKSGGTGKRLELKERPDVGVYVRDLSSFVTQSVEEIEHVLKVGHSNRSVGRTNMNEHSSRSHAILVLTVESSEIGPDGQPHIRVGRLNLVDLAGSERQSKTGSEGQRFREATKINLSLSALGNVIAALTDQQSSHIPYRDSKLTRLLQDSLGGNSKTVMIANIGPASYNYEETLSTLRYSSRAKQIQNKPIINEDPKDALLREFQEEIARLKTLLEQKGTKRRQSRNNNNDLLLDGSKMDTSTDLAEREAEGIYREKQAKLEMERQRLIHNSHIIDEEKQRILSALTEREHELERERQEQLSLTSKIRQMQSKLLSGDGNLLDRTRKQETLLGQRRAELAEQRRREREVLQRLEVQELETAEIKQIFASLQQEVEAKRRKFQKLNNRLQQMRLELRDNEITNASERQNLEQTVLEMNKELALKWLIIDNFIPPNVVENIKEKAQFDENEHQWIVKEGPSNHQNFLLERRRSILVENEGGGLERLNLNTSPQQNFNSHLRTTMADSGLGSSNGCSSTQGPSDASSQEEGGVNSNDIVDFDSAEQSTSQHENLYISPARLLKRPMAFSGATRPISNWEMTLLSKLKNQIARSNSKQHSRYPPNIRMSQLSRSGELPEFLIYDEVLRSCSKNLLTFQSLAPYGSQVNTNLEEQQRPSTRSGRTSKTPTNSKIQRFVVDTSRIPIPTQRSVSRDNINSTSSRPTSAAGRRRGSLAINRASLISAASQKLYCNAQNSSVQSLQISTPESNNHQNDHSNNNSKNLRARSVFNNNNYLILNKNKEINKRMAESASNASSLEGKIGTIVQRAPSSPAVNGRIPVPLQPNYPKARGLVGGVIGGGNRK